MSSTPFSDLIKQAAEAKYTVIPAGDYPVIARDAQATKSSTSKDMIKLTVKTLVGPHKDATIVTSQTLSPENPAAVAIFLKFLAAFGLDEEFLASLPPREDGGPNMSAVCTALKGRVAMATVNVHEWDGEDRNGIDKFKKPSPEVVAGLEETLNAMGGSSPFSAPSAGPSDPFAAASATPAAAPAGEPF